ncbi:MAG TPA: MFS transporter [Blastocatellia bacterium]|nr:MFS transporter [Blastocatellia bacterium]
MSLTEIKPEEKEISCGAVAAELPAIDTVLPEPPKPSATVENAVKSWLSTRRISSLLFRTLFAVLLGSLIMRVASHTMGQMVQFYLADIDRNYYNISYTARGFITASFFITELLGSLVLGALSDRYGRKPFIFLGPLLGAIAVQITSMTVAIWLLVITRLLEGLSTASSIPATLGYISEATSGRPKLRARIVGLFEITLFGGMAVGAVLSGTLFELFGRADEFLGLHLTSPAFSINGLIYLISLAVFVWGLRGFKENTKKADASATTHRELKRYRAILRSPNVWKFVPAWLAINSIIGLWINHSLGLMTGKDHFAGQLLAGNIGTDKVGYGSAILLLLFAIGVLAWSFILGRYRRTSIMMIATGGLFVTLVTVYALNHLDSFADPLCYPLIGVLLIALLVLSGFTPASLTYLADVTESQTSNRGSIMGLYTVFLGVGQLIGTMLGGKFATWAGIDGLLALSAIFGVVMAWTLMLLRRQETPASANGAPGIV